MLSSGNYKELLNLIGHSLLKAYWKELPARLDKWGRLQQMSFKEAISTYISQDDEEKEKLKISMESLMQPLSADFHPVLSAACEMLNTWGIHEEDYPEYKEIINIANMVTDIQMLEFMLQSTMYRLPTPTGVCIRIMGPLEVRLMQPERVIIADMNEGEWPLSSVSNPWLHPKLREDLNLSSADYITAVSSKLFLSLLGCKYVYLCRTTHKNGQVTKASRWWDRIKVLAQLNNVEMFQDENDMLSMQGDNGIIPHFRIPEHLIPRRLSISQLHLWINNPTQFILSCILKLEELPEWEKKADNRDKGIIVHEVLEQGVSKGLSLNEMLTLGYNKLQTLTLDEHQRMFWESYITTCIHHFHKLQASAVVQRSWTEVKGEWRFNTQFGAFTLVGKADRIDLLSDGSLHIIDYKTGTVPSKNAVYKGLIPQLPILGLIAMYGGFEGIQANAPFMLSYWDLKEGSASHILFDDIRHLEAEFIHIVEQLLDPNAAFELDSTSKLNI
jgi:RecB family exonuclease